MNEPVVEFHPDSVALRDLKRGLQSLCDEWEKEAYAGIPDDYRRRGMEEKYLRGDNHEGGMMDCAYEVRSLLEDVCTNT